RLNPTVVDVAAAGWLFPWLLQPISVAAARSAAYPSASAGRPLTRAARAVARVFLAMPASRLPPSRRYLPRAQTRPDRGGDARTWGGRRGAGGGRGPPRTATGRGRRPRARPRGTACGGRRTSSRLRDGPARRPH